MFRAQTFLIHTRLSGVAHALVRAVSRLISTPSPAGSTVSQPIVGRSADAARTSACVTACGLLITLLSPACSAADFSGAAAFDFAKTAVAFGPRPAGSDANHKLQAYILQKVKVPGAQVTEDAFIAQDAPRRQSP